MTWGLGEYIAAARERLTELRGATPDGDGPPEVDEAFEALAIALRELEASAQEQQLRSEELAVARDELADRERAFRELFEHAPVPYIVTDPDGGIVELNHAAATLLGVPRDLLRRRVLATFVAPGSREAFRRQLLDLALGTSVRGWDVTLQPRRGSEVIASVDIVAGPRRDAAGDELRWVLRDVTAERAARHALRRELAETAEEYEQLREIDLWKDAFLTAAAHDLRAPLVTLETGAQSIASNPGLPREAVGQIAGRMVESARRLSRLLADLLDLDHFTRGRVTARRAPTDVLALVHDVIGQLDMGDHPVSVLGTPVTVELDDVRVEQIVQNLLLNAAKHTPAGTPVRVQVLGDRDGVTILVEDEGPGVPDEIRENMFSPFVSAASHDEDPGGTGIGLSLVRLFAELHGGKVRGEDRAGGGSRFIVELPARSPGSE